MIYCYIALGLFILTAIAVLFIHVNIIKGKAKLSTICKELFLFFIICVVWPLGLFTILTLLIGSIYDFITTNNIKLDLE